MRKIFLTLLIVIMTASLALAAYQPDIKILSNDKIAAISDDALLKNYIDACVEIQATNALHTTSGFTQKEYQAYKDLLRYRILLINEIKNRKLEVPQTE